MTSANLRLGATYWLKAGFTNLVYWSITPATSRPRTATSRCILQRAREPDQWCGVRGLAHAAPSGCPPHNPTLASNAAPLRRPAGQAHVVVGVHVDLHVEHLPDFGHVQHQDALDDHDVGGGHLQPVRRCPGDW